MTTTADILTVTEGLADWQDSLGTGFLLPAPAALRSHGSSYGLDFTDAEHLAGWLPGYQPQVLVQHWQPARPVGHAVVLHGLFDHAGLYGHLIRALLDEGYAVTLPDLPGHGLSAGPRAHVDDFADYLLMLQMVLAGRTPGTADLPLLLVGQSTGGAVVLEHLASGGGAAGAVVLAPLVRPRGWQLGRPMLAVAGGVTARFAAGLPRKFRANSSDPVFNAFLPTDPLQPRHLSVAWVRAMHRWQRVFAAGAATGVAVQVVQGDQDGTVAWRWNLPVIARRFAAEVHMVAGARHHLVNETPALRAQVLAVVRRAAASAAATRQQPPIRSGC